MLNRMRLIILMGMAALLYVGAAGAQILDITTIKELESYNTMTEAEVAAKTDLLTETPRGDKFLEYTVRLPKGWTKIGAEDEGREFVMPEIVPLNVGKKTKEKSVAVVQEKGDPKERTEQRILGPVARYHGPVRLDHVSRFEVEAIELKQEITTRNWFLNYLITSGFTLQGIDEIDDRRIEAEYVALDKDIAYVVRTAVIMNGSRMVMASYYVPDQYWKEEKAFQDIAIKSFSFVNPEVGRIENVKTYAFLDLLRFDYPVSWILNSPNIYSVEGMSVHLIRSQDRKTLSGEIDVNVISTETETTLSKEVETLQDKLREKGLEIGDLIASTKEYEFQGHVQFSRVEVYEANNRKQSLLDHEYWLAIMAEDRYYYIVTMLTPGRTADFYSWALNTEAFETVIETMRP